MVVFRGGLTQLGGAIGQSPGVTWASVCPPGAVSVCTCRSSPYLPSGWLPRMEAVAGTSYHMGCDTPLDRKFFYVWCLSAACLMIVQVPLSRRLSIFIHSSPPPVTAASPLLRNKLISFSSALTMRAEGPFLSIVPTQRCLPSISMWLGQPSEPVGLESGFISSTRGEIQGHSETQPYLSA